MRFAKPQICLSPINPGQLCIAYPYVEDGEWIHKEDLEKTLNDIIGQITFVRGITIECQIHNAINRERKRIKEGLII